MRLTDPGLVDWKEKGRKLFSMASSKGHSHGVYSGRTSRPRLDRSFGNKGIDYDSSGSLRRRSSRNFHHNDDDDSDRSSHHSGDWALGEFSVHGKKDVEEMNSIFRYLGLPGPANLGIDNEDYELIRRPMSGSPVLDHYNRQDSQTDFTFPRQDSDGELSSRAPSSQGPTPPFLSPRMSPPAVGQFARTEAEIVDAALVVPVIRTPPGSEVRAHVENRTPTAAGAAALDRDGDGGAARRDKSSLLGFVSVVKQAVAQHQAKIEHEAADVENFIMSHGDGDLPRFGSLPARGEDTRSPPGAASVRSRSGMGSVVAAQPIERASSEPIDIFTPSKQNETSVVNGKKTGGRSINWKHVDNGELLQSKSIYRDSEGPSTTHEVESGSDRSSRDSVSLGKLPVAAAKSSTIALSSERQKPLKANPTSKPIILKPPPPMILRIPQEQFSTKDILGSLAPDAAEEVVRSYFSASDDDEEIDETDNASDSEDKHESAHDIEGSSPVSGGSSGQSKHLSNGDVSGVAADEENGQGQSNGDVSGVAGVDGSGQGKRTKLTVDVPERNLTTAEQVNIGGISAPDLPPLVVNTPVTVLGPKHPWSKGDVLGQGSFGTVYDAVDSDGMWFAVKEVSMIEQDKQAQQSIAQLMQEIELLSQFKHDNVVQYLGTEKAHGKLYIFLELVSRGSLSTICKRIKLNHSQISAYTKQILKGLKYLHDRNIVHRDIKCANILVDTNGTCKVADFGMAKQMNSLDQMKSCKGSAYWMAPEVIDPKKFSGLPADIWSLGCCVLEMATGSPPFGDMEWYRVLWTVGHGTAPPIPDTLSENAKDFVKRCLEVTPTKRPTATDLLNHPFVRQDVASTPTSQDAVATFQAGSNTLQSSNTLQPITEERSADFSSGPSSRTQNSSSLLNGHSVTASS